METERYGHLFTACGHNDLLWAAPRQGREWIARADGIGHSDLPRLLEAGLNLQVFALFSDPAHRGPGFTVKALEMIERFHAGLDRVRGGLPGESRPVVGLIRWREELEAVGTGFGALLSIEGGEALGGSLVVLDAFFRLGVRAVGLVWNHRNELADGVFDAASGGGLTRFGRQAVRRMNSLGMAVDVSHLSEAGFWDVVRESAGPFIASHSNARALCDHPRNLSDDQLRAVAAAGGVIGVNFCGGFLVERGRARIDHVVDHLVHVAGTAGIDHVALGTDYDGIDDPPAGLEDVTRLPRLIPALESRGFGESDIRKVMGENLRRTFARLLPETPSQGT